MSVNKAYTGERFKTKECRTYVRSILYMLPKIKLPEPPYRVSYVFGVSNMASDIDNPVKLFQDILQKKYGFNDKEIHSMEVLKVKTKRGSEFIKFEIEHYEGD